MRNRGRSKSLLTSPIWLRILQFKPSYFVSYLSNNREEIAQGSRGAREAPGGDARSGGASILGDTPHWRQLHNPAHKPSAARQRPRTLQALCRAGMRIISTRGCRALDLVRHGWWWGIWQPAQAEHSPCTAQIAHPSKAHPCTTLIFLHILHINASSLVFATHLDAHTSPPRCPRRFRCQHRIPFVPNSSNRSTTRHSVRPHTVFLLHRTLLG